MNSLKYLGMLVGSVTWVHQVSSLRKYFSAKTRNGETPRHIPKRSSLLKQYLLVYDSLQINIPV